MAKTPLSPQHRRLFVFLGCASFFDGYDTIALTQILPNVRASMGLSKEDAGMLVAVANIGAFLAFVLVRMADRWGRRAVLTYTILGYTVLSVATGFAPGPRSLAVTQLFARMFLMAEWAVCLIYAAEEYPAERRGAVIGWLNAISTLGAIFCAGVVPMLLKTPLGWRSVYFVGVVPLLLVAYARRTLTETKRFTAAQAAAREAAGGREKDDFFRLMRSPYRWRALGLGALWLMTYASTNVAVTFWKEFAVGERGLTDAQVGLSVTIAAVGSMPLVFAVGSAMDRLGRRPTTAIVYGLATLGVYGAFTLHGQVPLTAALVLGIFGSSAVLPVLSTFTSELFPTNLRGNAHAWANNVIGRIGYVIAPAVLGSVAEQVGWGPAVSATAIFPVVIMVLVLAFVPETKSRELEETALV